MWKHLMFFIAKWNIWVFANQEYVNCFILPDEKYVSFPNFLLFSQSLNSFMDDAIQ